MRGMSSSIITSYMSIANRTLQLGSACSCEVGDGFTTTSCFFGIFAAIVPPPPGDSGAGASPNKLVFINNFLVASLKFPVTVPLSSLNWPVVRVLVILSSCYCRTGRDLVKICRKILLN